jgi:hypothetical protein
MEENGEGHTHGEVLREVTVELETDQVAALEELARDYARRLGQQWDLGAVVRLAVGDFLTRLGKMT